MTAVSRLVIGAALCGALLLLEAPHAGAAPDPSPTPPRSEATSPAAQLLQAVAHYQRSEFDEARRLLQLVLRAVGRTRSRTAEEAYTHLAFVQVAFGETDAAVESFERALAINPELQLGSSSPRIATALEQARRRHRARVRALDHDPPRLAHTPPAAAAPYGRPQTIAAEVGDVSGVRRVVLNFRVAGDRGFSTVTMEPDGKGGYVASVPATAVVRPGVEYFIEAWDTLGNGPGLKGSSGAPIRLEVKGGPLAPTGPRAGRVAWFKRWWVWAIAAGAIAATGGIVVGAYLSRSETARFDIRLSKDLNP